MKPQTDWQTRWFGVAHQVAKRNGLKEFWDALIVNFIDKELTTQRTQLIDEVREIAKHTTFGHDDKKLGTIIAMDYEMFVRELSKLERNV